MFLKLKEFKKMIIDFIEWLDEGKQPIGMCFSFTCPLMKMSCLTLKVLASTPKDNIPNFIIF